MCLKSARRSRLVKSMKVLLGFSEVWFSEMCLGAVCFGGWVSESESDISIGVGGVLGVFGGVDSDEDGNWGMITVVPHGNCIASGDG